MKRLAIALLSLILMSAIASIEEKPANILKNGDFENGLANWTVPVWMQDTLFPQLDSSVSKNGNYSVKFSGEKGRRVCFMQIRPRNPEVKEYKISGWIKTENASNLKPGLALEIVYTENNATKYKHESIFPDIAGTSDWIYVEKKISLPDTASQIRMVLSANSKSDNPSEGNVWFDCVQLEEIIQRGDAVSIREIVPGGDSGLFRKTETPYLNLYFLNSFPDDKNAELEIILYDYFDKKIYEHNENILLDKLNVVKKCVNFPKLDRFGFYSAHFALKINNMPAVAGIGSFVIFSPVEKPDTFFGFSQYGLAIENIKTARNMGAGTAGVIIPWKTEYEKGKYDWSESDKRINECVANGMKIVGGFCIYGDYYMNPQWVLKDIRGKLKKGENPYTEQFYKDAADFEYQAVLKYKNLIHEWSAINEIDLGMERKYEKEHYIKRVKDLYSAIKKVSPDFELGGIGVSGCDGQKNPRFPAAKSLWKELNQYLDLMAHDPYVDPKTFGPGYKPVGEERGNLREILLESLKLAKSYGKNSISIDEKGYDIVSKIPVDSVYAKQLARTLAGGFVIAKSVPENRHWLYFVFKGAQSVSLDFGLWIRNCPRPAVATYSTVAGRLAHASSPSIVELHKDIYCFVFKKEKGSTVALWTTGDKPIIFKFNMPADGEIYDIMNNPSALKKGRNEITISNNIIFIECGKEQKVMVDSLRSASFTLPQIKAEICLKSLSSFSVDILNQIQEDIKVKVKPVTGSLKIIPSEKITNIPSKSKASVDFDIGNGSYSLLNNNKISVEAVVNNDTEYLFSSVLELLPVERIRSTVKIDGDLSEFKAIKPLAIDNSDFVFPVDVISSKLWTGTEDLSYKVYLAYDDRNFYFAAEVTDDVMINENTGFRMWQNDSFQIAFDTMNDASAAKLSGISGYDLTDYEFGFALSPKGPQCFCYTAASPNKAIENKETSFDIAVKRAGKNTMIYELAIPWSALGPLKPEPGKAFRFNFICLDSDKPGQTSLYCMGLSQGIWSGKNPEAFKTFVLMP